MHLRAGPGSRRARLRHGARPGRMQPLPRPVPADGVLRAAARQRAPAAYRLGDGTGSSALSAPATTARAAAIAAGRSAAATQAMRMISSPTGSPRFAQLSTMTAPGLAKCSSTWLRRSSRTPASSQTVAAASPRAVLSRVIGDGPRVHLGEVGQQAPHEGRHPPWFDLGEPGSHPQHQLIEFAPPAIQVHAEASGHRTVICCPHLRTSGGGRVTSTAAARHDHEVSLEYQPASRVFLPRPFLLVIIAAGPKLIQWSIT